MGESIMAASTNEDKIGGTVASDRRLEVSVSFGRFENDSLSWDKWSSFSQNKYLEEVEKCATPGSVAQKKAYFEAHYKKIAARKAELLDQKIVEDESPPSDDQNGVDSTRKFCGEDSGFDVSNSNGQTAAEGTEQETKFDDKSGSTSEDVEETNEDDATNTEGQVSLAERVDELERPDSLALNKPEEAAAVKEGGTQSLPSQELPNKLLKEMERTPIYKEEPVELNPPKETERIPIFKEENVKLNPPKETERIPIVKEEPVKLNPPKESRKISPSSKVRDMTKIKKKPASPVAKSPQISTVKVSNAVKTYNTLSTNRTPTKKVTGSSLPKNKICSLGGSKKVAPKTLHMSLSMDTPSPDPAPPASAPFIAPRKSFIMEKMKDKEIVKRAFKTFQNSFNQLKSSSEEKSVSAKQVTSKGSENKVSSSITPRKENAGSLKAFNMDKRSAKTAPSSFGLKSNERAEKSNEKLQDTSKVKQSESSRVQTKSKEEKDAETRKLRQGFNFRATPTPGFYQGHKLSRTPLDKEGSKTIGI
ncbi:protein WVD2-like 7 [Euphorbia lathyris]|uniref:protein WVD2-like 7 n=1 Tax=Euphorbia lathyris TaxID=212925 RepID=UPI00331385AD